MHGLVIRRDSILTHDYSASRLAAAHLAIAIWLKCGLTPLATLGSINSTPDHFWSGRTNFTRPKIFCPGRFFPDQNFRHRPSLLSQRSPRRFGILSMALRILSGILESQESQEIQIAKLSVNFNILLCNFRILLIT